jgi:hypothetical protein
LKERRKKKKQIDMALSNFLLSVVVVGAGYMLLRSDVRRSAVTLRSNLKHIKRWLEQEAPSSDSVRYSLCLFFFKLISGLNVWT